MIADILRTAETIARDVQERFSVRTVYGEPITASGITIVPVGVVAFGFGGGGGGGGAGADNPGAGGGGGGGGGLVRPTGYIEITDAGSRWVPIEKPLTEQLLKVLIAALASLPGGRRGGLLAVVALVIAAQPLIARALGTNAPSMPEGVRRFATDSA